MFTKPTIISKTVITLVFKTNASLNTDLELVSTIFKDEKRLKSWNFDFEDCDNIFRVETAGITATEIIQKLASIGIHAEELDD